LLGALRKGESLLPLIEDNIGQKAMALGGQFAGDLENIDAASIVNRSMITIGG
jgi:cyclic pyranopterin phosphate synthase